jgi:hypothetical protein
MDTTRERESMESMPQEFEEPDELEPTPEDDEYLRDTIEIGDEDIEFE